MSDIVDIMFRSCPCGRNEPGLCTIHNWTRKREAEVSMTAAPVKQVIVIRRDLRMRRGKEIAQGAHASMLWVASRLQVVNGTGWAEMRLTVPEMIWMKDNFRKITCQVPHEEALLAVMEKAHIEGVTAHMITDSGLTEFHGVPTNTACAIGPDYEEVVDRVTRDLMLY